MGKSIQIKIPDLMNAIHRQKSTVHANERAICRESLFSHGFVIYFYPRK